MNQQTFFKPRFTVNLYLLWFSHYSLTWGRSLHWLCQFTQFSFISQLLSFDLLPLRYWISSPSYRLSAKHTYLFPFSLDSTWFPAPFDTADHRCWHLRQLVWLSQQHSVLILLSFSDPLNFPSNFAYCSIPIHFYVSPSYLYILLLSSYTASSASISFFKIQIFFFTSLFNISIWCSIDMSGLNDQNGTTIIFFLSKTHIL